MGRQNEAGRDSRQSAEEQTVGMTPEQEQEFLRDGDAQHQPADGGIGAMTDTQGRDPDTSN
ncbi:hypothetical protein IEE91_11670 [Kocuria sp. cx-455]|uniref:hypothetical protein n=1 Tax=unclassified Candidatus Sulfotelmatobacter TaxID=2635724 RepID=UPI001687B782|nr:MULTISPECIES: hypothetical protein [unclassified Candidatus Sulfotelmatobacter]MBD2763186.1 hypothetical protein [Kocuria sp. cx-116]MBD2765835.1 hypothetical protein [Kocuria sp. cx-455]